MVSRHPTLTTRSAPKVRTPRQALQVKIERKAPKKLVQDNRPPPKAITLAKPPATQPRRPLMAKEPTSAPDPKPSTISGKAPEPPKAEAHGGPSHLPADKPPLKPDLTPPAKPDDTPPTPEEVRLVLTTALIETYCQHRAAFGTPGNKSIEQSIEAMAGGTATSGEIAEYRNLLANNPDVAKRLIELGGIANTMSGTINAL